MTDGVVLSQDFNEPGFDFGFPWEINNDAYAILEGALHSDGVHRDGSGRYVNNFIYMVTFASDNYIEYSFRGLFKEYGN